MSAETWEGAVERIGMVARWQPVHLGHAAILRALCRTGRQALIGLGSANRHNLRHPFTAEETAAMIRLVLPGRDNYQIIPVPDLDDGPRWRRLILDLFGPLDLFVTDNPYVASLLDGDYRLVRPVSLVPLAERLPVDGTAVRLAMARGEAWQALVPPEVARYLEDSGLDERFRREFGLEALVVDMTISR